MDFFSLSLKSKCRKEILIQHNLLYIDNFSFPKDVLFHRGVCIVFLLGDAKDISQIQNSYSKNHQVMVNLLSSSQWDLFYFFGMSQQALC